VTQVKEQLAMPRDMFYSVQHLVEQQCDGCCGVFKVAFQWLSEAVSLEVFGSCTDNTAGQGVCDTVFVLESQYRRCCDSDFEYISSLQIFNTVLDVCIIMPGTPQAQYC
jgi:hypothetical protein